MNKKSTPQMTKQSTDEKSDFQIVNFLKTQMFSWNGCSVGIVV